MLPKFLHKQIQVLRRLNMSNSHKCWEIPFFITAILRIRSGGIWVTESGGIRLALQPQVIRTFLFEMAMPITLKTSDSLNRLGLLPFSPFEVLLFSGTHEFPFITKFPIILELHEFLEILCKVGNILFDYILTRWIVSFYSFIYRLKSKWFALSLIWQWKLICLERTNQLLDFDFINVFALLNCSHLCMEALR